MDDPYYQQVYMNNVEDEVEDENQIPSDFDEFDDSMDEINAIHTSELIFGLNLIRCDDVSLQ